MLAALVPFAAGCGGKSAKPTSETAHDQRAESNQRATVHRHRHSGGDTPEGARGGPERGGKRTQKGSRGVLQRRRDRAASVSRSIAGQFGLSVAAIAVSSKADSVTIGLTKSVACTATGDDAAHIGLVVRRVLGFVKSVRVAVVGTDEDLNGYATAHCTPPRIPGGPGRIVFDRKGVGTVTTGRLVISAKRWTVAFDSRAAALRVDVLRRGSRVRTVVSKRGRGTGKTTVAGPGTFKLRIASPAVWRIQVRDGG